MAPPRPGGRLAVAPQGRKQWATRLVFAAGLAVAALSRSAWGSLACVAMLLIGYSLVRLAILGRTWTALYLVGSKKHSLVVEGPYAMCRNPLYFFTFVGLVGIGLAAGSLTVAVLVTVWFGFYYPGVIRKEERKLLDLHGESYRRYRAATPAFMPRATALAQLRDAAQLRVLPAQIRANTQDYLWMIWGLGLVQAFTMLHWAGILPVLMQVY